MNEETQPSFSKLSWITATAGTVGSLIPGWAYFTEHAPPAAEVSALITSAVALAVVLYGLNRPLKKKPSSGRALTLILISLVLIVGYGIARDYTTVPYPAEFALEEHEKNKRLQIGFYLAPWSLTQEAIAMLEDEDIKTVEDLMLAFGAYTGKTELVWKPLTITAAGSMLLLLFTIGFLLWAYSFALLARALSA